MPQALAADARLARPTPGSPRPTPSRHDRRPGRHDRARLAPADARLASRPDDRYAARVTTPALLAIDLGTTQAKAGLIGLDGRLLALARAAYPLATDGATGAAEQDPAEWWAAIRSMTAELLAVGRTGRDPGDRRSTARARPSWRPAPTGVRSDPAITWMDTRSAAEEAELAAATGERRLAPGDPARALLGRAPSPGRGGRGALVPRQLGVGRAPAERGRRRDEPARARSIPTATAIGADRTRASTGSRPGSRRRTVLGPLLPGPAARARPATRDPGRRRDGRRPRELRRRGAARAGRRDRHRRDDRRVRRLHRPSRSRSPASSVPRRRSPVDGSSAGR